MGPRRLHGELSPNHPLPTTTPHANVAAGLRAIIGGTLEALARAPAYDPTTDPLLHTLTILNPNLTILELNASQRVRSSVE